jgi:hypothetical protein
VSKAFSITTSYQRFTFTLPADTGGDAQVETNAEGFAIHIGLNMGSNFTSGTLNETWQDFTNANRFVGVGNLASSTDNNFFITGIQLEVGSQATPFEHRSFGEELNLCRRYLYKPDLAGDRMISMVLRPDNKRQFQHFFPVQMRADPTATTTYDADGSSATLSSPTVSKDQFRARTDALSTTTQDPRLTAFSMDAEL